MIKASIYILIGLSIIPALYFTYLSVSSRNYSVAGLVDGKLAACPQTANCVCSEHASSADFIEPFTYPVGPDIWLNMKQAIIQVGGQIERQEAEYMHATFTSSIFRFIDDVELRLDRDNNVIHIRSASRVGRSDLGVNKKRVEKIRSAFIQINQVD